MRHLRSAEVLTNQISTWFEAWYIYLYYIINIKETKNEAPAYSDINPGVLIQHGSLQYTESTYMRCRYEADDFSEILTIDTP